MPSCMQHKGSERSKQVQYQNNLNATTTGTALTEQKYIKR